jgi:hypothetical protein
VRYGKYGTLSSYTSILFGVPLFGRARLLFMVLHKLIIFLLARYLQSVTVSDIFFIRDLDLGDQNLRLRFVFEGSGWFTNMYI